MFMPKVRYDMLLLKTMKRALKQGVNQICTPKIKSYECFVAPMLILDAEIFTLLDSKGNLKRVVYQICTPKIKKVMHVLVASMLILD